jgi:hypothetical protein
MLEWFVVSWDTLTAVSEKSLPMGYGCAPVHTPVNGPSCQFWLTKFTDKKICAKSLR